MKSMNQLQQESALYRSYVIRLTRPSASLAWRYSVVNILTGETHAFANLTGLVNFLSLLEKEPGPTLEPSGSSDLSPDTSDRPVL
jgi:hypothetical protein